MASPRGRERAVGISERVYRSLLRAYPRGFGDEYGDEMARSAFRTCAAIAVTFGLGTQWGGLAQILGVTGLFVALFVGSALLFRYAGRERTPAGAGPEG